MSGIAWADIYVSELGSDDTGDGSEVSPYRTITKALSSLGAETAITVGAGLYNPDAGEVFPLTVPVGVSIFGTMGDEENELDSTVIDAGGTANAFVLPQTTAEAPNTFSDLVVTGALGTAFDASAGNWPGTIDGCVIKEVANTDPSATAAALFAVSSNVTITDTTIRDINSTAPYIVRVQTSPGSLLIEDCTFQNLRCTGATNNGSCVVSVTSSNLPLTIRRSAFDNANGLMTQYDPAGSQRGAVVTGRNSFLIDACIFRNISYATCGAVVLGYNTTYTVQNSLFHNITAGNVNWYGQNVNFGVIGTHYNTSTWRNCTFDACSSVVGHTQVYGTPRLYNCSVTSVPRKPFTTGISRQFVLSTRSTCKVGHCCWQR